MLGVLVCDLEMQALSLSRENCSPLVVIWRNLPGLPLYEGAPEKCDQTYKSNLHSKVNQDILFRVVLVVS